MGYVVGPALFSGLSTPAGTAGKGSLMKTDLIPNACWCFQRDAKLPGLTPTSAVLETQGNCADLRGILISDSTPTVLSGVLNCVSPDGNSDS